MTQRKPTQKERNQKIIDDLVEKGNKCKVCLNCKFSYLTEETGFGFCYYSNHDGPPTLLVKPIFEMHSCKNWQKKNKKEKW